MSHLSSLEAALSASPRHHGGARCKAAFQDVPEIDMPGHMQAALAAYPELGCTGGPYEVWKIFGEFTDFFLTLAAVLPTALGAFVTAYVYYLR